MNKIFITREITRKDSISTILYLKDIGKFDILTPEEEVELIKRVREGDESARSTLIFSNLRFVVSIAKKYQNHGMGLSDLISEGNFGLMEATLKFDETLGFRFITYAVWWIRQSISRAIADKSKIVRVPSSKIWLNSKIRRISSQFEQEHYRLPSVEETAIKLKTENYNISSAMLYNGEICSMEAPIDHTSDVNMYDVFEDNNSPKPDAALIQESLKYDLENALSGIPEKEAEIIKYYFGVGGRQEISIYSISIKFNISEERVRQIKELGLKRLRTVQFKRKLEKYLS